MNDNNTTPEPTTQPASEQPTAEPTAPQPESPATPAAPTPAPAADKPAPESKPAGGHKKRVLLVEDDDSLAKMYQTRLESEGLDIRRVPNGEDALAGALEFKPDLILLDVMMPKVSGFDVLDILRNTPETTNAKVIMLTALSQEADKQRAEELAVDDYLVKSQVVIADVVEKVKLHLGIQ